MCNMNLCASYVARTCGQCPELKMNVPTRNDTVATKQTWRKEQKDNIDGVLNKFIDNMSMETQTKNKQLSLTSMSSYLRKRKRRDEDEHC